MSELSSQNGPLTISVAEHNNGLLHTSSVLTLEHQLVITLAVLGSLVAAIQTFGIRITHCSLYDRQKLRSAQVKSSSLQVPPQLYDHLV